MRRSRLLEKFRAGRPARSAMPGHPLPPFAAYDAIWLDREHHPLSGDELRTLPSFCRLCDIDGPVRPATRAKTDPGRCPGGASGLVRGSNPVCAAALDALEKAG